MNNQEMLEKLIQGTDKTETIKVNVDGTSAEFELKPLTAGELSKLQSIEKKGFNMSVGVNGQGKRQSVRTNDVDINVGEFTEFQNEAMYTAISLSTGLSVDDLKLLPVGFPEALFENVIRISNLSDKDLTIVKSFRQKG